MPNVTMTLEEYEAMRRLISSERESEGASLSARSRSASSRPKKKRRKASKYQIEFGKQMKKLKAKHKRTPVTKLMKKAHAATKKVMK